MFQPARVIADQLLGLLGAVQLPSLSQHTAKAACNGFGNRSMMLITIQPLPGNCTHGFDKQMFGPE